MRDIRYIILCFVLMIAGSCAPESLDVVFIEEPQIEFTASKMRVITKAGDSADQFDEGTKFRLFAVSHPETNYNWSNSLLYNQSGEVSSGMIDYGEKVSYGVEPLNVLDFYGVTYGDESDPTIIGTIGDVPKINVTPRADGKIPDLMYSDNLKSKTSASGRLEMEFRHTMSKLNVEILKQDESDDVNKKLESATLTKLVLNGTGVSGTYNIETGSWESVTQEAVTLFEGTKLISKTSERITSGLLSIPVSGGKVSLDIYLDGIDDAKENPITYTLTIGNDALGNDLYLNLEQNHEYTISIVVLKNDVRVVTVTPQIYDWVDVDLDKDDAYLGQPVYFGGLMWMDRNLGATSADCENDWYNTVGYYYQFGRNVPFILDVDKWIAYTEDDGQKDLQKSRIIVATIDKKIYELHRDWDSYTAEKQAEIKKLMVECVYSLDHKGNKVYGYHNSTSADHLIRKPGEVIYDALGVVDDEKTSKSYRYGSNVQSWTKRDNQAAYYWKDVEDQPCPKGWRLPTRDDLFTFMPRGSSITQQVNWNDNKYPAKLADNVYNTVRYGYIEEGGNRYNVCYMIKNPGKDNAYRIRIRSHFAKNTNGEGYSKNKRYISITRYSATKDDKIENFTSETYSEAILPGSKENTLWNNPIESADFPGCGYFVPDGHNPDLRSFGWGTIMRTSDPTGFDTGSVNNQHNWVQYMSVTDYKLSIHNGSRRALGDQVRCVRDVNVTD